MNARGERCRKRAVRGRFCLVHAGEQDMRLLGKKGGSRSPLTKLRKAADDSLREQARAVLARALAGEQVDKEQLAAARSLFSYRSDAPPVGEQGREQTGGKVVVLGDLIRVAVECGLVRAADGGAILVGDEIIKNADPSLPSREESQSRETWDPSPPATNEASERQAAELVGDAPPEFDDSAEARLRRRYGSDDGNYSWVESQEAVGETMLDALESAGVDPMATPELSFSAERGDTMGAVDATVLFAAPVPAGA
jgi:hypothetical protein